MTQTQIEDLPQPSKSHDEKTSVLYLNHVSQMSGAEQSLRALLWQFRRDGTDIDPLVVLPGSGPFADVMRDEAWNVTFAPMRRLHRPQGFIDGVTSLVHVLQTAPFIARLGKQTGANIIHSNSTTAHLVGGLAAERINVPSVWHVRDLVSLAKIAPALAARSTVIIAISYAVAQRLEDDGVPAEKICTIHNGLDPDEWNVADSSAGGTLRETLGIDDDAFVFGCVGQLVPWKNHKAFIEAAASLVQDDNCDNARFVIMGGDLWGEQKEYVKELRALVKEYNLQGRFNFVPHQTDAVAALCALDCIVLASHEEPFGRVLIEGMSLRKPVIAYNENGPSEIITHEKDGLLVDPQTDDGLALAMMQVLHEPELCRLLGDNGRASVTQKFHIADSAQKVAELYHKIRD